MKFATKPILHYPLRRQRQMCIRDSYNTHLTLRMLLHYLWKLNIQFFCRYSADMEENANKLHY